MPNDEIVVLKRLLEQSNQKVIRGEIKLLHLLAVLCDRITLHSV